jgi:hypothetical protein
MSTALAGACSANLQLIISKLLLSLEFSSNTVYFVLLPFVSHADLFVSQLLQLDDLRDKLWMRACSLVHEGSTHAANDAS